MTSWKEAITAQRQASSSKAGRDGSSQVLKQKNTHAQPGSNTEAARCVFPLIFSCHSILGCPCKGKNTGSVITDP